jgi:hypothetical protein
MNITVLDFDTYIDLDWSRYDVSLSERFTEEQARGEYYESLDQLVRVLEDFGTNNAFGERDFTTGDDWHGPHRSMGFAITSDRLLVPELIPSIQALLRSLPNPYMVEFDCDFGVNKSKHGIMSGDFDVTVEVAEITITTEKKCVLDLLGLEKSRKRG